MQEKIKEDWELSDAEKQNNYEKNLEGKVDAVIGPVDTLHTFFGHEQTTISTEDVARSLRKRLSESIKKLTEVINNFENGNPNLKNEALSLNQGDSFVDFMLIMN